MDIMLGFEPSGVGSIPAGPARTMIICPVNFEKKILKGNYAFTPGNSVPIRVADSNFILKQLGISHLSKDISMLVGLAQPRNVISIHKDSPLSDGTPIKWSLLFVPQDDGEVDIDLEIVRPKDDSKPRQGTGPLGYPRYYYLREDCDILDSYNLKHGSCYFDPTSYWHGMVNHSNKIQYVFSLRSGTLDVEHVIEQINANNTSCY